MGFILEEGFPMDDPWRIAQSISAAAGMAGVRVVTGDTKVVDRGKGDGIFINTSAVGQVPAGVDVGAHRIRPGDVLLVSGPVANHGIALLSLGEGLQFETRLESDSAPLNGMVAELLERLGDRIHAMRDPTRGGVASATNEMATAAGVGLQIQESSIPVDDEVRGACETLGLDLLYVANEGKMLVWVDPSAADEAVEIMAAHPFGRGACRIGEVVADHMAAVSAFVERRPRIPDALGYGLRWAVGHGGVILVVGAALILFRIHLPESAGVALERLVGVSLIVLGGWVFLTARRLHAHLHTHGDTVHAHGHAATAMGAVHGLAGTAPAVALVPLAGMDSTGPAFVYLAVFGLGTALSMGLYAMFAGWAGGRMTHRSGAVGRGLARVAGLGSVAVGILWLVG